MDRKLDVLFFFPPGGFYGGYHHHLGVAYLQAFLKKKGFHSQQFVPSGPIGLEELLAEVKAKKPRVLGLTCYDSNYLEVKVVSSAVKKRFPDILVFVGGPMATFEDKTLLRECCQVDLCVRFEGEFTLAELLAELKNRPLEEIDLQKIPGLTFRSGKEIVTSPERNFFAPEEGYTEEDLMVSGVPVVVLWP